MGGTRLRKERERLDRGTYEFAMKLVTVFKDRATTGIYTLSLNGNLPIALK